MKEDALLILNSALVGLTSLILAAWVGYWWGALYATIWAVVFVVAIIRKSEEYKQLKRDLKKERNTAV